MASLLLFRGKSATGKTTLTKALGKRLNRCVLRKDDIFDPMSQYITDNSVKNELSYTILANMILQNLRSGADVIVDIALPHTQDYQRFLDKLDLEGHCFHSFLCVCTDEAVWLERWRERLKHPLPNQYFRSLEEIVSHYAKMEIAPLPGEVVLDSCMGKEVLLQTVLCQIAH